MARHIKDPSVDDFTICFFGNREYLYGMGNHLKIQTKSIFRRFLWLLCSSHGVLLKNTEFESVFFQTLKLQEGNDISSTWTPSHLVSRALQVAQEVRPYMEKEEVCTLLLNGE